MSENESKPQCKSYYNQSEIERFTVSENLIILSEYISKSEDPNNIKLGERLLIMGTQLFNTLPTVGGVKNFGKAELTNENVTDVQLDDIITNFLK